MTKAEKKNRSAMRRITNLILLGAATWFFFSTSLDEKLLGKVSPHVIVTTSASRGFPDLGTWPVYVMLACLVFIIFRVLIWYYKNRIANEDEPIKTRRSNKAGSASQNPPITSGYNGYPPNTIYPGGRSYGPVARGPAHSIPPTRMPGYHVNAVTQQNPYATNRKLGKIATMPLQNVIFWHGISADMGDVLYDD